MQRVEALAAELEAGSVDGLHFHNYTTRFIVQLRYYNIAMQ